jgi:hypothetical protein
MNNGYRSLVEPYFRQVRTSAEPKDFVASFGRIPRPNGLLLAAYWCDYEVQNGGFLQFFTNPTGVLAPEALAAFEAIERQDLATLVRRTMAYFGDQYPRSQDSRIAIISLRRGAYRGQPSPFANEDLAFYACLEHEPFKASADRYAAQMSP